MVPNFLDSQHVRLRNLLERISCDDGLQVWALSHIMHQNQMHIGSVQSMADQILKMPKSLTTQGVAPGRGCPLSDLRDKLRRAGLRPTRQRVSLGWLLFAKGNRHVTAESLYEEASRARVPVSLATVYNTLHQFTDAGLLRQLAVDGSKSYFDTNPGEHHHFFVEEDQMLVDMPYNEIMVSALPEPPEGHEITRIEVIVRVRRKTAKN